MIAKYMKLHSCYINYNISVDLGQQKIVIDKIVDRSTNIKNVQRIQRMQNCCEEIVHSKTIVNIVLIRRAEQLSGIMIKIELHICI